MPGLCDGADFTMDESLPLASTPASPHRRGQTAMNYDFMAPCGARATARVWTRGAYGFSAPKKVEVVGANGRSATYLYRNINEMDGVELSVRIIARIAIHQFLNHPCAGDAIVELNSRMPMFDGRLMRSGASAPATRQPRSSTRRPRP